MQGTKANKSKNSQSTISKQQSINRGWLLATALLAIPALPAVAAENANEVTTDASKTTSGAKTAPSYSFDIPSKPLSKAIADLAAVTGIQVLYTASTADQTAPALKGNYTVEQAFSRLLKGSQLAARYTSANAVTIEKSVADEVATLDTVRVVGEAEGRFGDAPAEPGGFKAEYQTTATKTAMSLRETPQAISVVTRESMDARQANDIFTALETTAGIGSAFFGHPGPFAGNGPRGFVNAFSIRGQVLNNDRDIRSDGFALGGQSTHDLIVYERVEVVRGPSGFYGQGSLGGFINMVRKKPQAEFSASVSGQVGSYDTYRGEVDITGAIDGDGKVKGRFIGMHSDAGSFVDEVETERSLIAPSVEVNISDNTRALFQMLYQKEEFIPYPGVPLVLEGKRYKIPNVSRSFYFGASDEASDIETLNASLRVDHELNDNWLVTLLLQGERVDRHDILGNYAYGVYAGGTTYSYASRNETEQDFWSGELRVDGKFNAFGREHKVLAGIEVNKRRETYQGGYSYLGAANIYADNIAGLGSLSSDEIPLLFGGINTSKNTAAYGQVVLGVLDKTKLLVSARYDRADQKAKDTFANTTVNKVNKEWTTRLGLSHEFTPNISAYTSYAQSFNPVTNTGRTGGKILDPETGEGVEVGLKTEWFNKKLGINMAVYRQELDNQPITDPNDNNLTISDGLFRTDGVELEVNGSPYPGLTVSAAASLLDSEYIDRKDEDKYGLTPWGTIEKQFSLYTNYEFQKGALKGFGVGASYINVGEIATLVRGEQQFVDGYERVDLNFSYKGSSHWDMALQVRNVFDKTYIEKARGGGWGNYFGAPRSALFKATYHF